MLQHVDGVWAAWQHCRAPGVAWRPAKWPWRRSECSGGQLGWFGGETGISFPILFAPWISTQILLNRYKVDAISPGKTTSVDPRITAMYTKMTDLVGIDELITRLTKEEDCISSAEQRIISIVGFGGLGKTTLAKAVFDKIKAQFNCSAFISVSQNPDMTKKF